MSDPQPTAEYDDELSASALDPNHHAIVPSDKQQDLVFRSIKAIDPRALQPHGLVSCTALRRTPEGVIPTIRVRLNEIRTSVIFEVTLLPGQCIQVHVPDKSWLLNNCDSEAVRAAIQMAYLNLLRQKPGSVLVRPGMVCREIVPMHIPKIGHLGKTIARAKEWSDRKRRRREKADKPGASHRKERMGGAVGGGEEGNRSGSGSGSGELTYSESRSSASSYTSENSASEHAAKPSTRAPGTEKERLLTAVMSLDPAQYKNAPEKAVDVTEMLLSSSKKERTLCLFSVEYLRARVESARSILDALDGEELPPPNDNVAAAAALSRDRTHLSMNTLTTLPPQHRVSRPGAGSPEPPQTPELSYTGSSTVPSPAYPQTPAGFSSIHTLATLAKLPAVEIVRLASSPQSAGLPLPRADPNMVKRTDEFINGLVNKRAAVQKQLLGEKLFKVIKGFGIKNAPRITLILLDNEDPRSLAHLMNSYPSVLKEKALQHTVVAKTTT